MTTQTTQRTVTGLIWEKVLDLVEQATLSVCIRNVVLVCSSIAVARILNNQATVASHFWGYWEHHKYLMITTVGSFYIMMNLKRLLSRVPTIEFVGMDGEGIQLPNPVIEEDHIHGIPVSELLDHLITHKSFKRMEVEQKFGIPRHKFTMIADELEAVGLLTRGENNSRVLNSERSRYDMQKSVQHYVRTGTMSEPIHKTGEASYTVGPTAEKTKESVQMALLSCPTPLHLGAPDKTQQTA